MNSEICKKCGNKFYLMQNILLDDNCKVVGFHFSVVCRDKNGKAILEYDFPLDISRFIENEISMNKKIRYCYEVSYFSEVKPSRNCPYYAEHQMKEWNER